jgi:hypothetical protein
LVLPRTDPRHASGRQGAGAVRGWPSRAYATSWAAVVGGFPAGGLRRRLADGRPARILKSRAGIGRRCPSRSSEIPAPVVPTPMVRVDGRAREPDPHQLLALHPGSESSRRVDRDRSDRILKPAKVSGRDFELLLSNLPARRGPGTEPMEVSPGTGTQSTRSPFPSSSGSRAIWTAMRRASSVGRHTPAKGTARTSARTRGSAKGAHQGPMRGASGGWFASGKLSGGRLGSEKCTTHNATRKARMAAPI